MLKVGSLVAIRWDDSIGLGIISKKEVNNGWVVFFEDNGEIVADVILQHRLIQVKAMDGFKEFTEIRVTNDVTVVDEEDADRFHKWLEADSRAKQIVKQIYAGLD